MSKKRLDRKSGSARARRRVFDDAFKQEAVQMMLDGHSAGSVAERLALSNTNLLYRWKQDQLNRTGPVATSLDARTPTAVVKDWPRHAKSSTVLERHYANTLRSLAKLGLRGAFCPRVSC